MATINPFDLLGDDAEDPSHLIAAEQLKAAAAAAAAPKKGLEQGKQVAPKKAALLPSKPLPPSQAVRESRNEPSRGGRGGGRGYGGGFGRGRGGGGGFGRDFSNDDNSSSLPVPPANQGSFEGDSGNPSERRGYGAPRAPYRVGGGGGRRGGFSNGEGGEEGRPRRTFDRHSGTGRGGGFKREGAGRGNWGTQSDEIAQVTDEVANETEKNVSEEKPAGEEDAAAEGNKEAPANEAEEKEPEDKEMTLEEYEKVLEEKRKALQALKVESRKVDTKEFESMKPLSCKKENDEIFAKLGSDKDKRKDAFEKEKARKALSINEFLKPAEGEKYYSPGGRGGRGRGGRGGSRGGGGYVGNAYSNAPAPSIEDPGQFPTLGGGK
ncbi:unnamed protein product [Lathyrus oleraceus]|uniref:Hyaluronan/mRNA-binding protein domain-containing protein n=1 Tax=Pisum sativum TaxID=3888 RepID=A0A9D5AT22_PEA|nr:RGG repeats nuclear RNA binding protein A-like [Pisum sativum]KAI5423307.1 hypothetical protein KIW84_046335 [Pisum sativum]